MASKVAEAYIAVKVVAGTVAASMQRMRAMVTGQLERMREQSQRLTSSIFSPTGIAVGGALALSAREFAGFESALAQMVGLVGVAKDEVGGFERQIRMMAESVGQSPKDLAQAMFFITSAGLRGKDALEALGWSAKASASGLGDVNVVGDLVTSAMNAYGPAVLNAKAATDVLVATVREGKAAPDQLAGAMGQILPIASQLQVRFDEVGATIAAMTRTGTSAATASVQLKSILTTLLKPTKEGADQLERMGMSAKFLRQHIVQNGLIATLTLLKEKFDNNDEATAMVFGNVRALSGIYDILGANLKDNLGIFDRMTRTAGITDEAFNAVADTLSFKWMQMLATIRNAMVEIGALMKPSIEAISMAIRAMSNAVANMSPQFKQLIGFVIAGAAALAALGTVVFVGLKAWAMLAGAVSLILSPLGLLIGLALLVGYAIKRAFENEATAKRLQAALDSISASFAFIWAGIMQVAEGFMRTMGPTIDYISQAFTRMFEMLAQFIEANRERFVYWAMLVGEVIVGTIETAVGVISSFFSLVNSGLDAMGTSWGDVWSFIASYIEGVLEGLSLLLSDWRTSVMLGWTTIKLGAVATWDFVVNQFFRVVAAAVGAAYAIGGAFSAMWDNMKSVAGMISDVFKNTFKAIGAGLSAILRMENPATAFRDTFVREMGKSLNAMGGMKGVGEEAGKAFNRGFDGVMKNAPPAVSALQQGLQDEALQQVGRLVAERERKRRLRDAATPASAGTTTADTVATSPAVAKAGKAVLEGARQITVKFETTGIVDMWKKMQQSMGTTTEQLNKRTAEAAEAQVALSKEQKDKLDIIARNTAKQMPATAG